MPASQTDKFANKFYGAVTESAQGTLTFAEIQTNVSVFDKVAWVLHRLEWYISTTILDLLAGDKDYLSMALVSSNKISALGLDNPAVIDLYNLVMLDYGTPGNNQILEFPMIRDFSQLPGGGVIITPRPLYVALVSDSIATPATAACRGYFTIRQLAADEYLELVDFYRIVS